MSLVFSLRLVRLHRIRFLLLRFFFFLTYPLCFVSILCLSSFAFLLLVVVVVSPGKLILISIMYDSIKPKWTNERTNGKCVMIESHLEQYYHRKRSFSRALRSTISFLLLLYHRHCHRCRHNRNRSYRRRRRCCCFCCCSVEAWNKGGHCLLVRPVYDREIGKHVDLWNRILSSSLFFFFFFSLFCSSSVSRLFCDQSIRENVWLVDSPTTTTGKGRSSLFLLSTLASATISSSSSSSSSTASSSSSSVVVVVVVFLSISLSCSSLSSSLRATIIIFPVSYRWLEYIFDLCRL
jgi:hypothetical protein